MGRLAYSVALLLLWVLLTVWLVVYGNPYAWHAHAAWWLLVLVSHRRRWIE
jgi:hypothetical protein